VAELLAIVVSNSKLAVSPGPGWRFRIDLTTYANFGFCSSLIFQTNTVAMSFVLAWLVQRSGSIWPAALAHAANNVLQSGTPIVANDWRVDQIAGTLASIVIGAICAWLLIRRESHESAGPERIAEVPSKELLRRAHEADWGS